MSMVYLKKGKKQKAI